MEVKDFNKDECYCNKCKKTKPFYEFYRNPSDMMTEINGGYFLFCKKCTKEIVDEIMTSYGSKEIALVAMCNFFNIPLSEEAIKIIMEGVAERQHSRDFDWIQEYLEVLKSLGFARADWNNLSQYRLCFDDNLKTLKLEDLNNIQEIIDKWGTFTILEYEFLERTWTKYTKGLKLTPAQESLYAQLCLCELSIRKKQSDGDSFTNDQNTAMKLMSKLKIDDFKVDMGLDEKLIENRILQIERTDPADCYKDLTKFKDVQGIEEYMENAIMRPMRNLVANSKDYKVIEEFVATKSSEVNKATKKSKSDEKETKKRRVKTKKVSL